MFSSRKQWSLLAALVLASALPAASRAVPEGDARKHGPIAWIESFAEGQKAAAKSRKIMLVDFWAEWCAPCKAMLKTTYQDKAVVERSKTLVPVLIDLDKNKNLGQKYGIKAIPLILILDGRGKVLARAEGYRTAPELLKLLDEATKKPRG